MKKIIALSLLFVVGIAAAQPIELVANNEKLRANIPDGWKLGYKNQTRFSQIREYIPGTETIPTWTQMITLQSFSGLRHVAAQAFLSDLEPRLKKQCKGFKSVKQVGDNQATMWAYCTEYSHTKKGEITFFKVFKGKQTLFVVQRAWRGAVFSLDAIPLTTEQRQQWQQEMNAVRLGSS